MKIGFIGCGNMGGAMIGGIVSAKKAEPSDILVSDASKELLKKRKEEYGISIGSSNKETASSADILFLAVKPQYYEEVIADIKNSVRDDTILVSIAPGKTISGLKESSGGKFKKVIRIMPNTPALVGEGMTGMVKSDEVTDEELKTVRDLIDSFSRTEIVDEKLMDVVTAVSGSSPAYVFMFIEAMADAAVAGGMPRDKAYVFASQAVLGSAKMVLETKKHPGELKDMVCSPGGTTIQAVRVLEEKGFRSAVIECMEKCLDVSRSLK